MKRAIALIIVMSFLTIAAGQASGQDLMVFPAKGQSQQQIERDKFDCYSWAKQQAGFDPMQTPPPAQPNPLPPAPGPAAGGAAIGGITGGWSGAGKGAAIGAVTGGVFGGLRSQARSYQSAQSQQQLAAQQSAQYRQRRDAYNRANAACLEGKGYSFK